MSSLLDRRRALVVHTEAAVAVALSVLLGNVRLVELPNGGSIALATLPLLALALTRGVRTGVLAGVCAGAAHALAGGTIVHPVQLALDYLVAYGALGLAGVALIGSARPSRARASVGILLAMGVHLAAMVVSGVVFFAQAVGAAALTYSLTYNAATVVPETVLALCLAPTLALAVARANPADSWRRGLLDPPRMLPRTTRSIHVPEPIDTSDIRLVSVPQDLPPARPALAREPAASSTVPPRPPATPIRRSAPFVSRTPFSATLAEARRVE